MNDASMTDRSGPFRRKGSVPSIDHSFLGGPTKAWAVSAPCRRTPTRSIPLDHREDHSASRFGFRHSRAPREHSRVDRTSTPFRHTGLPVQFPRARRAGHPPLPCGSPLRSAGPVKTAPYERPQPSSHAPFQTATYGKKNIRSTDFELGKRGISTGTEQSKACLPTVVSKSITILVYARDTPR